MSRQLSELENILQSLVDEHRRLLRHVTAHEAAMKTFNLNAMDEAAGQQEAARLRIATLDSRRRLVVTELARQIRAQPNVTITQIAALLPNRKPQLLKLRDDLKSAAEAVSNRTRITGRVAGAVLGHLNTVVRLLAGAVERAGLYTKNGIPQVSRRIGVIEAVG
jgi:hypothetical protein